MVSELIILKLTFKVFTNAYIRGMFYFLKNHPPPQAHEGNKRRGR